MDGINRKPVNVIFTLEVGIGLVVGRKVIDVRICSCPKRDTQQKEEKLDRYEQQARTVEVELAEWQTRKIVDIENQFSTFSIYYGETNDNLLDNY